jgi:magnesium transporter
MITEFLSFEEHTTTHEVLEDLRQNRDVYADYDVQYIYVTKRDQRLVGVLKLRDMLLSKDSVQIGKLIKPDPIKVKTNETLINLRELFESHNIIGIPVVDRHQKLVGVVRRAAVEEALANRRPRIFSK